MVALGDLIKCGNSGVLDTGNKVPLHSYLGQTFSNNLGNVCLQGMCFCQFVLHNEQRCNPPTIVEHVKDQVSSMRKNALKKSHNRRRSTNSFSPPHYMPPTLATNGTSHFPDKKSASVTFI